ncbi:MAG: hypothetical protein APR54_10290 [Candidatus Cloacimonas sp. SDB]|nr:MAG: hypothetical protein APR54_10290 [Candidatus Cloacimonas sp. SDB]
MKKINASSDSIKTLIISSGKSVEKLILLLSTVILSRHLTQTDFGTYRQVFLVTGILLTVFTFGIPQTINYFLPLRKEKDKKTFIYQTFLIQVLLGFVASLICWYGGFYIARLFSNPLLENYLKIFALFPLFFLPANSYTNIFICINRAKLSAVISIVFGIIRLAIIVFAVVLKLSLSFIFVSLLLYALILFLTILLIVSFNFSLYHISFSLNNFIRQLKFALPIGLSSIIGILIIRIDQFMISSFFSVEDYAVYSVGTLEIPFVNILTVSSMAVITPYLVKQYKANRLDLFLQKWNNSLIKISYVIFPVTVFFIFFARETIIILYTDRYTESSIIFLIYLLRLFVKITFFGHILVALGSPKAVLKFSIITLILNIILNFLFIRLFGFTGPAIASVVAIYVISLLQLIKISGIINKSLSTVWPWKDLLIILISAFISASISYLAKFIELPLIILMIAVTIVFSSVYLLLTQFIFKRFLPGIIKITFPGFGVKKV